MNIDDYLIIDQEIQNIPSNKKKLENEIKDTFMDGINNDELKKLNKIDQKLNKYILQISKSGFENYDPKIKRIIAYLKKNIESKLDLYLNHNNEKKISDQYLNQTIDFTKTTKFIFDQEYEKIDEFRYERDLTIIKEIKHKTKELIKQSSLKPKEYKNYQLVISASNKLLNYINKRLNEEINLLAILRNEASIKYKNIYNSNKKTLKKIEFEEQIILYDSCIENIKKVINN